MMDIADIADSAATGRGGAPKAPPRIGRFCPEGAVPININRFQRILEDIASDIPDDLLRELNGGIVLLPEAKRHPEAKDGDLFVLGEYRVQIPGMGRYVAIFYGSFKRVFARAMAKGDADALRAELRKTLLHELTHHLESLAGVRDLEIDDERKIADYQRGRRG